jgi:predicted nucleic acid-binding protein
MIAVVDASVVLKWFLQEPDAVHALTLRERHLTGELLLAAPDLLLYEVGNALRFKHDFTTLGIQEALSDLLRFQLELIAPTERLLHHAVELAHRSRLTYYDGFYLAVASDLGTKLITADKRLHEASHKLVEVTILSQIDVV